MAISNQYPVNFDTNVILNPFIWVQFDTDLDRTSIDDYNVILIETDNPGNIISGRVDYIVGTRKVTFQLFDFLKKDTSYTFILVGGTNGIKLLGSSLPWSANNYVSHFTTGQSKDWNIPLATSAAYEDGPPFQGHDGIYKEVFGRTGEPVSHIVTTSAQVSPSGKIVPAPWGPERYIQLSGEVFGDYLELLSTDPEDKEITVTNSDIKFIFNSTLQDVGSVIVKVLDILEGQLENENDINNYALVRDDKTYTITPSGELSGLRPASDYIITLTNITDIEDRSISSLKITFQTKISPYYTSVKLIRLRLGKIIYKIVDDTIRLLIYLNSLWAYENAKEPFDIDSPTTEAINYVICKTQLDLLEQIYIKGGTIESKELADLKIQYGPAIIQLILNKMKKLEDCVGENILLLTTGNGVVTSKSAVKSYWDLRKPNWNRLKNPDTFEE